MTLWQRFYRAIGGLGPDEYEPSRWDLGLPAPLFREFCAGDIAVFFMWLGLLAPQYLENRASHQQRVTSTERSRRYPNNCLCYLVKH